MGRLLNGKIRLHGAYSANDWRLPAELFEKRARDDQRETGAYLLETSLLPLRLWATKGRVLRRGEGPVWVELSGSTPARRVTGIGASRPLWRTLAIVSFLNP